MPKAVIVEVADALTAALAAHNFGVAFTPTRSYADWQTDLLALEGVVRVDVVPHGSVPDLDADELEEWAVTVDVLIRQRFGLDDQAAGGSIPHAAVDQLVKLVEDIWRFVIPGESQTGQLETDGGYTAAWDPAATQIKAHYVRSHWRQRQFTGWIRCGFTVSLDAN